MRRAGASMSPNDTRAVGMAGALAQRKVANAFSGPCREKLRIHEIPNNSQ
jgi:hypothetical protein